MVADDRDEGPGPDPAAGGRGGVEVVYGPAAGIGSVEGGLGGPDGGLGHRLVDLPIVHTGEGAGLIDHAGDGAGEGGVADPVEDHRPHRHLAQIGLAPGLGGDDPCQESGGAVHTGGDAALLLRGHAQGLLGGGPHHAVGGEAVPGLELLHCGGGLAAVDAVCRPVEIAPAYQLLLDGTHRLSGGALPVHGRLCGLGQGDEGDVQEKDQCKTEKEPLSALFHGAASRKRTAPSLRRAGSLYAR